MKSVSISGSARKNVGKKDAKLIRREGNIPAVLYGSGDQSHFQISENDANKLIRTPNVYMVNLDVEGKASKAIIKEVQFHPVTDKIIHLDFLEVIDGKPVKVELPISISGFSVGVRNGGKLVQNFRRLKVEGLESNLPDAIDIDITELKIGSKTRVSDIEIEGINFLNPASAVVVAVQMARGASEEEEEEDEEEEATEEAAAE